MIRHTIDRRYRKYLRYALETVQAVCDWCEAPATDPLIVAMGGSSWESAMAQSSARLAGFVERLDGRVSRLLCPLCACVFDARSGGSSGGSVVPAESPIANDPRKQERVNGFEPSTFSLGSNQPPAGEAESSANLEARESGDRSGGAET